MKCHVTLVFAVTYLPYTMSVLSAYGTQEHDSPACLVRCLELYPHLLTLRMYLIGLNVFRFLVMWGGMNLLCKLRSMSCTVVIGLGVCAVYIFI